MTSSSSTNASSSDRDQRLGRPGRAERRHRSGGGRFWADAGTAITIAATIGAPLAIGGVHRPSLIWIGSSQLIGLMIVAWAAQRRGDGLRIGPAVALPVALLAIPLLQSIPLPRFLHHLLDPAGVALLDASVVPMPVRTPLSLDPPSSRAHIAMAAAALTTFLAAYHAAGGQRRRQWFVRAVGLVGVAALIIGVSHRIFGVTKIYGLIPSTVRTLIFGPFVNANHTAELLELSGFASLACIYQRPTALNRIGWSIPTALCFAGTAATLSRGAVLAIGTGLLVFLGLIYASREQTWGRPRRSTLAWTGSLAGLVAMLAAALGADRLIARFHAASTTQDIRFQLWRDSLLTIRAHPLGIGRGAFDRVYPVYRTLKTTLSTRFAFVEDEPLQLLIDSGWVFFGVLAAATIFVAWRIYRRGRRDRIEAALLAGVVAVLAHNLIDFGLETPGVLLPFMAILGSLLGRAESPAAVLPGRIRWGIVGLTCVALLAGTASVAHPSHDPFDRLIKASAATPLRRSLLVRAQQAHPTDYFYVLQYAGTEPLKPAPGQKSSPRLHALNHAIELCPSCGLIHQTVAQNLWQLGFARQALAEWRSAIDLEPQSFGGIFEQIVRDGATPNQMAAVASPSSDRLIAAADFLSRVSRHADALLFVDFAQKAGAPPSVILPLRARLLMVLGKTEEAAATLTRAQSLGIRTSETALLEVQLLQRTKGPAAGDEMLAILDRAAKRDPNDVGIQRARLETVVSSAKWSEAERALEGLRDALYHNRGSAYEAHVAAARLHSRLSHWRQAVDDYRMALTDAPEDINLWLEFGHAAESAGKLAVAREAYTQAARLAPHDPAIAKALQALDAVNQPRSTVESLDRSSGATEP